MFERFNRHYFDLLWVMTIKEFTIHYKRAFFGLLWVILNPLFQMLIIGTVFSYFVKIPNYYLFIFSGLLPWQFFSFTVTRVVSCYVNERVLLQKAAFPREIIPLSIVFSNFINFFISEVLFIAVVIVISPFPPIHLLYFILAIFWLLLFTIGFSLLISSYNVRFRDVNFLVSALMILWFYATPILYTLSIVPEHIRSLMVINPLASPFILFHSTLWGLPFPSSTMIVTNVGISIAMLAIGIYVFYKESPYFVDWL